MRSAAHHVGRVEISPSPAAVEASVGVNDSLSSPGQPVPNDRGAVSWFFCGPVRRSPLFLFDSYSQTARAIRPYRTRGCRCSCVEQSGHNDARRLHRWLEHGSKAHLQCVLSSSFAGAARQAHAKAVSTSSGMDGEELFRGALASCCSSVEQAGQNDARRLHRWLEHGSKAHLQRVLSRSLPLTKVYHGLPRSTTVYCTQYGRN